MAQKTRRKVTKNAKETPLMKQYNSIKAKYPDAILLFRMGDFYETFGQDAIQTAQTLGIVLTKRHNGAASEIELAGFPYHALDMYLPKLVKAGFRIAICEQLEDPKRAKKLVKRGVTELITPGVVLGDKMLDHTKNNYLAAVHFDKKDRVGVSFVDASTGEFLVAEGTTEYIDKLLQSLQPAEVILSKNKKNEFKEAFGDKLYTYPLDEWIFAKEFGRERLLQHFQTPTLKGYGVDELNIACTAAGAIIHYLGETQHPNLQHITNISRIKRDRYVWLDRFTIRNLELLFPNHESGKSLLDVMDKTISPMGSRLLKKWVALPLQDKALIESRQKMVEHLTNDADMSDELSQQIKLIGDLERLIARVTLGRVTPKQVVQIKKALYALDPIIKACKEAKNEHLNKLGEQLNPCNIIREKIDKEINEETPADFKNGGVIQSGVHEELDELRLLKQNGKDKLDEILEREIKATGIASLKIGQNNVFGYYLEVRHKFKEQVPDEWIRRQTLVNSERYITEELKRYEVKIMGAEEKILEIEQAVFNQLVSALGEYIRPIQLNAALIAKLDCLLSFCKIAKRFNYCRPEMNDSMVIDIKKGRHPVIEQQLQLGEEYVPNDVYLDTEKQQILLLTGPNMSGKSALLRQTALIVLMAQMGSFVPAENAAIGKVDKVFTRVGASDNISSGESTFMVEMNETASIMNNISPRSLILLDEIGRGTSTYDGISIAWALAEYLHNHPAAKAKTLFATHYHELTELSEKLERIHNFTIAIREVGNKIVFLRKLVPGAAQKSFGIHVADMAGMPKSIVKRANEVLAQLEESKMDGDTGGSENKDAKNEAGSNNGITHNKSKDIKENLKKMPAREPYQLSIFEMTNPNLQKIEEELITLDVNTLTPIEALMKLNELKKMMNE